MNNIVLFSMKNENSSETVQITGVQVLVKELRIKIKEKLRIQSTEGQNNEELQLFDDNDKVLTLADRVRCNQKLSVVRLPKQNSQSYCHSCWFMRSMTSTPCCTEPICQVCEQRFTQISKCPFTIKTSCQFSYNYSQQPTSMKTEIQVAELAQIIQKAVFYIVKSNNETNVHTAKKHNIWATTHKNFKKLLNAFALHRSVILIFTANRTERFLGCAKMMNTYVAVAGPSLWQGTVQVMLADNFGIEWLRRGNIAFSRVAELTNPMTGESITKSRDCQEIPENNKIHQTLLQDIGRNLALEFEQIKGEEIPTQMIPSTQPDQSTNNLQNYPQTLQPISPEVSVKEKIEQNQDDDDQEWDFDAFLPKTRDQQSPKNNEKQITSTQAATKVEQSPKKEAHSENESEGVQQNANPQQQQMMQQMMMQQNPMYMQMLMQQQMQQQMDTWNTLNKGKIPGLTGKIKYQHPYFTQMMHQQNNYQQQFSDMVKEYQKNQSKPEEKDSDNEGRSRHRKDKYKKKSSKQSKSESKSSRSRSDRKKRDDSKDKDKDRKKKSHKQKKDNREEKHKKAHKKH